MRGRFQAGTSVRREFDLARFRDAVKDVRHWVSYGVVGTATDAGEIDDTNGNAILITPGGVMVDVVLLPALEPVTCRYAGVCGGRDVTIFAPIHPGDEVLVTLADGELGLPPVIVAVLNSRAVPLPVEQDGKPVFRNDRLSVYSQDVPIEVRTAGGARVVLGQDETVIVNQGTNGVARLHDTTKLTMSPSDVLALASQLLATGQFVPTGSPPSTPLSVTFTNGEITSASDKVRSG